jgi:hypothetical protein
MAKESTETAFSETGASIVLKPKHSTIVVEYTKNTATHVNLDAQVSKQNVSNPVVETDADKLNKAVDALREFPKR